MSELQTPYAPASDDDGHEVHHHLSPWALAAAIATVVLAIGIGTLNEAPVVAAIGVVLVLFALVGWVREDHLAYPKGPNPLTAHTVGNRDTLWWGIWLFLASEVVIFGAIFAGYFTAKSAAAAGEWPPHDVHLPILATGINTAILVTSGFAMHFGEVGMKKANRRLFLGGFGLAILLGATFLVIQAQEYMTLLAEGVGLSHGVFASTFYLLTGTHGLHVAGGLFLLILVFIRALRGHFGQERHSFVTSAALYWHFVDVVWIILYLIVYIQVI